MNAKSEQALVGLFVIVAAVVLIGTVFTISGAFGRSVKTFHTYFGFAGGLEPGATVRYSGGMKAGRVEKLTIDPQDPSRIEVTFSVQSDLPVKTDSKAKIMSLSPLGENHLEIVPGSAQGGSGQRRGAAAVGRLSGLQRVDEEDQRHRAGCAATAAHAE